MSAAAICRLLLSRERAWISEIADSVYVTEAVTRAALAKLVAERALQLVGGHDDMYEVNDKAIAERIAFGASKSLLETHEVIEAAKKREAPHVPISVTFDDAKVEDGIPIPSKGRRDLDKRYPFPMLEVGQSFSKQTPDGVRPAVFRQRLVNAAVRFRRKNPRFRFVTCMYPDGLIRLWRQPDSEETASEKAGHEAADA